MWLSFSLDSKSYNLVITFEYLSALFGWTFDLVESFNIMDVVWTKMFKRGDNKNIGF